MSNDAAEWFRTRLSDDLRAAFASADRCADDGEVSDQDADGVLFERIAKERHDRLEPLRVALSVFERVPLHEVGGLDDATLGEERQERKAHGLLRSERQVPYTTRIRPAQSGSDMHATSGLE